MARPIPFVVRPRVRCRAAILLGVAWTLMAGGLPAAAQGELDGTGSTLFGALDAEGWSVGLRGAWLARELKSSAGLQELDAYQVVTEVGRTLIPGLQLAAQLGWAQADIMDDSGESGLAWAVLGRAALFESVLESSPEVGRQRWVGLEIEGGYRYASSNLPSADFDWSEVFVIPYLYYRVNHRGDPLRTAYRGTGVGVQAGLVFSGIEGDVGPVPVEENRNFGFVVGGDVRWTGGWASQLRGFVYGSGDHALDLGLTYRF